jgi:hypothetical protein
MKTTAKRITVGAAALSLFLLADLPAGIADTTVEPSPIGQMARGLNPANWRMPQWTMPNFRELLQGNDEKARIKKKKDGLFDEVTKTASNSWSKTKQTFNPQKLSPANFFPASARTPSARKQKEKPGFFRSLLTPQPPVQEKNSTVTDFLRQPRPGM